MCIRDSLVPEFTANLVGPILLFIYMFTLDWRLTLLSLIPFAVGMATMMSVMNAHYKEMFGKSVAIGQHMNLSLIHICLLCFYHARRGD